MFDYAWAKLDDGKALPVSDHGTDVSAVMAALLDAGWQDQFHRILGRDLTSGERERLLVVAFLHDMGKTNSGFWRRQIDGASWTGHLTEVLTGHGALRRRLFDLLPVWGAEELPLAMLAHHGRPIAERDGRESDKRLWNRDEGSGYDPLAELDRLVDVARRRFPAAFGPGAPVDDPRAISLFAGLLTLADWIGSNPARFPIDAVTGEDRAARSAKAAMGAVTGLGLGGAAGLRARAGTGFSAAFGFTPKGLQSVTGKPNAGRLTILEADTGSGKTEAALWRFMQLLSAGEVDGLYLALPTRTSAVQMQTRVQACMDRVFGAGTVPVTLALPGYIRSGDIEGQRMGRWDVLWPDDPGDALRDARWASEAPKRFLAARVAVGTVDQALLSGLKTRHAHLRAACLSRSLLVVDEVHASDTYMTELLAQTLQNHLGAGGHAMLLSATLGAAARTRLQGKSDTQLPDLGTAQSLPYPAFHGEASVQTAGGGTEKQIRIDLSGVIGDPDAIARQAIDAARSGARVLILRNSVDGAVAVQSAMEAAAPEPLLWSIAGHPALHHGRFAAEDRRLLDTGIETDFGEKRPQGGLIAVGTQTLEISLDLDADLIITDLAPMDVLLQRFGRLHRHSWRARPDGFDTARAIVLTPAQRDLTPFLGKLRDRHGLGPSSEAMSGVYPNLPSVDATWAELARRSTLDIPRDNRALVESTTHPEAIAQSVARNGWEVFYSKFEGAGRADKQQARAHILDLATPFAGLSFPEDDSAATRLGARDRLVALPPDTMGAFGIPISRLRFPAWMVGNVPLETDPRITAQDRHLELTFETDEGQAACFLYDRLGLRRI